MLRALKVPVYFFLALVPALLFLVAIVCSGRSGAPRPGLNAIIDTLNQGDDIQEARPWWKVDTAAERAWLENRAPLS